MSFSKGFCSFVLAATTAGMLWAEPRCPGNAASVPLHLANGQMIVPVSINHSGPYKFLLDTGTQVTIVDPSLAAELHLDALGAAVVSGVGFRAASSYAQVDLLEAGSHGVASQKVLVLDLQHPDGVDLHVRGVLGEDFLSKFDVLIDYDHSLLCLDDSSRMAAQVKGRHIALEPAPDAHGAHAPRSLILVAHLSAATRSVRLKLDSGTNASFLFNTARYMPVQFLRNISLPGIGLDGAQRSYATLPLQDLEIAGLEMRRVAFVTFAGPNPDSSPTEFDGMLATRLFRRVFICPTHNFVVVDLR